jgi:hypothetical protein
MFKKIITSSLTFILMGVFSLTAQAAVPNFLTGLTSAGNISVSEGRGLFGLNSDGVVGHGTLYINSGGPDFGGSPLGNVYIASPINSDNGGGNVYLSGAGTGGSGNVFVGSLNTDGLPVGNLFVYGNVGIGTTSPAAKLEVVDASNSWSIMAGGRRISHVDLPQYSDDAATRGYVDANYAPITGGSYLPLAGSSMTGDINMQTHNITALGTATIGTLNVTKITAVTIDPLYSLNGINYATFVSSISGGVKEEYVGKIKINEYNSKIKAFEAIIDFNNIKEGSDLWVWHKVVDFNSENVDAAITPYNGFANVYYLIDGDKLIFRSNKSITASYRLIGKRFDWRNWPTKALDQTIKGIEIK